MSFKLIALDIDGTLLGRDRVISKENLQWIETARHAGLEVTLSTGRHKTSIEGIVAKQLKIAVPLVTLNGAEVWTPEGELLLRRPFADGSMAFLHALAIEHVIVIGDGFNDMEMIQWAGMGIAMGNAPDEVKHAAESVFAGWGETMFVSFAIKRWNEQMLTRHRGTIYSVIENCFLYA